MSTKDTTLTGAEARELVNGLGEIQRAILLFLLRAETDKRDVTGKDFLRTLNPPIEEYTPEANNNYRAIRSLELRGLIARKRRGAAKILTLTDKGSRAVLELRGQLTMFDPPTGDR